LSDRLFGTVAGEEFAVLLQFNFHAVIGLSH
jgi:hypothetical protein